MIREENINCTVEALILASPEPVSLKKICEVIEDISSARIRQAVDDLNNVYLGCGSSFRIREVAGGYQVHILPDFEQPIKKLIVKQRSIRLSRAALETLAIIAYKQPVTKIDIEHIRGVATDGVIHKLLQRQLIVISGRAESPGRPLLYKTSNEFLKFFGLNRLSDLPRMDEIEEMIRQAESPKEQTTLALEGKEDEIAPVELTQESPESGNGDGETDSLTVTADISDLIPEPAMVEAEDDQDYEIPAGDDDSANEHEAAKVVAIESREIRSGRDRESVEMNFPDSILDVYDPLPDEGPPIFSLENDLRVASIDSETQPPEEDEIAPADTSIAPVESVDSSEKPADD
jgi:segregation and condensation protein B